MCSSSHTLERRNQLAIRDKITIKFNNGGRPHITEVKRPGGKVEASYEVGGFVKIIELTRKDKALDWTTFSLDEVRSVEFKRGT